ncbi:hypothetical protein ncot_16105 [Nocardioides sp. JQ2195]|uniref:TY-Chap domain-containing protein n=1 Tax=Nocardioides sp. JQ2195 TaxID=2592334 RepID=UPI00143E23DF|nr:hypothetical protein [Nocardioides sp. JQ2195]QIX27940.1 hypothetical protein ncot_16105 [Nocardioides sp. JQ2195]
MNDHTNTGPDQETKEAWRRFRKGLAGYLAAMTEDDHLLIEMPSTDDDSGLTTPYAQFAVTEGDEIRAELAGNGVLLQWHRLDRTSERRLARAGWEVPDELDGPNLHRVAAKSDSRRLALLVSRALEKQYAVPHPTLMSVQGWGPNAEHLGDIGLPVDPACLEGEAARAAEELIEVPPPGFATPRDQLVAAVALGLEAMFEESIEQDADGDFPLPGQPSPIYVRIHPELPIVEAFGAVVTGVRSRRQAAVEASLLNRDLPLVKFAVLERSVLAALQVPAHRLEADAFLEALPMFLTTVNAVRADLSLRTGARS